MSSYSIDFSEPLRVGFEIPAGGYNGPGGGVASTSLRLYGRGALEWGEGVNENLVRLTENFASASPPLSRVSGQLWAELKLYHYNGTNAFVRFDLDTNTWSDSFTVHLTEPVSPERGTYWWDGTTLWGYYETSTVGTSTLAWRPRSFSTGGSILAGSTTPTPQQTLHIFNAQADGGDGAWVPPQSVTVSATDPNNSTTSTPGTLWYDTATGTFKVWDGTAWQSMITSGVAATGDLDMDNLYTVTNLTDPVDPQDAMTLNYADTHYVPLSGNTSGPNMTGQLVLNANPTLALGAATKQYVDTAVSGLSTLGTSATYDVGTLPGNIPLVSDIIGKHTIWIPAGALVGRATAGASLSTIETTTNKVNFKVLNFDATTQEHAQVFVQMPNSWDESTVTVRFVWSHAATTINYSVVWGAQAASLTSGDLLDGPFGTAQVVTSVGGVTDTLYRSNETTPLTIGGAPAQGDVVVFQIYRNAGDVADTLAVDARLHGIAIYYNTDALNDA